jgi:hypothetical protein
MDVSGINSQKSQPPSDMDSSLNTEGVFMAVFTKIDLALSASFRALVDLPGVKNFSPGARD